MDNTGIENYIDYVGKSFKSLSEIENILSTSGEDIIPQKINKALALYYPTLNALTSEYVRLKDEYDDVEREYQKWYDLKFEQSRDSLIELYNGVGTKSIKPSVKEYDVWVRTHNEDYYIYERKKNKSYIKMRAVKRMIENLEKYLFILKELSSNMKTEMRSLGVSDQVIDFDKHLSRNKVRDTLYEDDDEEKSEVTR